MPIKKSALKRMRSDKVRHQSNLSIKNDIKTRVKNLKGLILEKKADQARSALRDVISRLNKAAQKRVMHKNKASRTISRLTKAVSKSGTA
ncbi:MAG: 30S ribosomal protein S20 [Candidatus Omnitrophica bacterium]|nr:30S ribosomal protein S20 [Candidatus Omnitrophota bacterium]